VNLVRWRHTESESFRVGIEADGKVHDLSPRYGSIRQFLEAFPGGWSADALNLAGFAKTARSAVKLGPPVDDGAGVFLVGANYKKHAEEAGLDVPEIPVIFMKPVTALVGPDEPIRLPPISTQMDYEGELAIMIGKTATRISKADAPAHVAGLTLLNDVTARDLQWVQLGKHRIVDWLSSKALDSSTPVGPAIVPVKAVGDMHKLRLKTWLNSELMQDGGTSMMVFSVFDLIEFLSARVTLRPGDIISTGTPFGVGGFRKIFLKPGDVLRVEIEGVGRLENPVKAAHARDS
jgi:2-keto-4-pentenoate hydratase/2-oxohepta-3-ene-1,7-dioic acid hydratase in catechol pathway